MESVGMIRVLQIVDNMNAGGIQSFIMNVYRRINRDEIQFDFLLCKEEPLYGEEIQQLGGRIFYVPARSKGILRNRKALRAFFINHPEFTVVHMHESSLSYIEPLIEARKSGVKKRIIHSHSTRVIGKKIHRVLHRVNQLRIGKYATDYIACGKDAAEWMFGKSLIRNKVEIIYNGIELTKFNYSKSIRDEVRIELKIENQFVIGHLGRFEPVKNHLFLLRVFKSVLSIEENSILLLAGTGKLIDTIKQEAIGLSIDDKVKFLGVRNDPERLYQAMDVFLLPSLYEGFPVSAIEAQANGLPCLLSDTITKEACILPNVLMANLNDSPNKWAKMIMNNTERCKDISKVYDMGFDSAKTIQAITSLYTE